MKKAVFLAMIQIFVSLSMFSQYYFYVSPSSERTKPNQQEKGMSNDETLNQIFKEFEVKSYHQSFPGAKNVELRSFYEIHLIENKESKDVALMHIKQCRQHVQQYLLPSTSPAKP
jgi:predicted Co/Zn/Cd cation transporter (cation efflux family)